MDNDIVEYLDIEVRILSVQGFILLKMQCNQKLLTTCTGWNFLVFLSLNLKGQGVPRGPSLKIEFLWSLYAEEQELPTGFYRIKKYSS